MSDADQNDAAGPQEQASGEAEKRKINDPLTQGDVESPRAAWQPQKPSPPGDEPESDEAGGEAQSGT